jgi:hypothetical protein
MGGKSGGDDGLSQQLAYMSTIQEDPSRPSGFMMNPDRTYVTKVEYAARQAAAAAAKAAADEAAALEEKPAEAAPVEAAPDPLADMPAAPATDTTLTPPATMTAGDTLGGAVLKPPRYWTGGLDQYENAQQTGRGTTGSMTTTQT